MIDAAKAIMNLAYVIFFRPFQTLEPLFYVLKNTKMERKEEHFLFNFATLNQEAQQK